MDVIVKIKKKQYAKVSLQNKQRNYKANIKKLYSFLMSWMK